MYFLYRLERMARKCEKKNNKLAIDIKLTCFVSPLSLSNLQFNSIWTMYMCILYC